MSGNLNVFHGVKRSPLPDLYWHVQNWMQGVPPPMRYKRWQRSAFLASLNTVVKISGRPGFRAGRDDADWNVAVKYLKFSSTFSTSTTIKLTLHFHQFFSLSLGVCKWKCKAGKFSAAQPVPPPSLITYCFFLVVSIICHLFFNLQPTYTFRLTLKPCKCLLALINHSITDSNSHGRGHK